MFLKKESFGDILKYLWVKGYDVWNSEQSVKDFGGGADGEWNKIDYDLLIVDSRLYSCICLKMFCQNKNDFGGNCKL